MSGSDATRSSISAFSKCVSESIVFRSDGSAMATATLPSVLKTGMTRYFLATWRGMMAMTSSGIFIPARLHDFRAELRGLGLRHVRRADDLVGHQQIHHAHAGSVRLLARLGDLIGGDEAEVHQQRPPDNRLFQPQFSGLGCINIWCVRIKLTARAALSINCPRRHEKNFRTQRARQEEFFDWCAALIATGGASDSGTGILPVC